MTLVDLVVEYLLGTAAGLVLDVGEGPDPAARLKHRLLVVDLSTRTVQHVTREVLDVQCKIQLACLAKGSRKKFF